MGIPSCLFWLQRRAAWLRPGLALLAAEKHCHFCPQTKSASSGSQQQLPLLAPDKICLFWFRTRPSSSGSREDLPLLVPDRTFLFWLKRRSASSGSGKDLPLLTQEKICLFWFRTRPSSSGSKEDLPLLVPDKTFLFWLKWRASSSLTPSYPLPSFDLSSVSRIDRRLSPPFQQYFRSSFSVCSPGLHPVRRLTQLRTFFWGRNNKYARFQTSAGVQMATSL